MAGFLGAGFKGITGNRNFSGLLALGTAALAIPLAAACANPVVSAAPVAVAAPAPVAAPVVAAAPAVVSAQAVAAVPAPAAAGLTAEQVAQGRQLFNDWSCSACHVLTDANAHGHIGPALDGNMAIDKDFVISRITNGQGPMPGFGGQLTTEQIDLLAAYVVQAKL